MQLYFARLFYILQFSLISNAFVHSMSQNRNSMNNLPAANVLEAAQNTREERLHCDLWVIGAGTLGECIIKQYKELYPAATIVAETKSNNRHEYYKSNYNIEVRLRSDRDIERDRAVARNIIICTTPSSSEDYAKDLAESMLLWDETGHGNAVFTSSLAVYGEANGKIINEDSPLDLESPRAKKLIDAEKEVLQRGGNVIRLAGLYNDRRGPHSYWMKLAQENKPVDGNANSFVNMLHYEDAAGVAIALLAGERRRGEAFIASDEAVITRRGICEAAIASKLFTDASMPQFTQEDGPIGKRCDSSKSKATLRWKPKYPSFDKYMRERATNI